MIGWLEREVELGTDDDDVHSEYAVLVCSEK